MKYSIVPRLLSMLAVWAALLAWQLTAADIGVAGSVLFAALITLPLAMSGLEAAFYRRHAFRNEYMSGPSWLSRVIGSKPLIFGIEIAKALPLALLLLIATLSLQPREWALLIGGVLVLAFLMPRLPGLLQGAVKGTYLYALSRRLAIWVSTALLWLESMLMLVLVGNDDFRGLSWLDAVNYSMTPTAGTDDASLVSLMLRIDAGVDGLGHWASYRLLHGEPDLPQTVTALLVLGAVMGLWFLLAWAYSRALVGATARPLAIWRPRPRRGADTAPEHWGH